MVDNVDLRDRDKRIEATEMRTLRILGWIYTDDKLNNEIHKKLKADSIVEETAVREIKKLKGLSGYLRSDVRAMTC
jgi:hypothetical protein